jgi:hypothetical protein
MDSVFPTPAIGRFEAITSALSALVYIVVAIGALASAPRDIRARLFLVVALSSLVPYLTPTLLWWRGESAPFTKPLVVGLALSATVSSPALFHFMQTFPWRRPWIRAHGGWLTAAYLVPPWLVLGLAAAAPRDMDDLTPAFALTMLLVLLPLLTVVGIVLPFAGLFSLYNSWLAAKRLGVARVERPLLVILVGQLAGGIFAVLIVPLLRIVVTSGPWATLAIALLFAFGLLTPIAFAVSVWRYGVLRIDPASSPF